VIQTQSHTQTNTHTRAHTHTNTHTRVHTRTHTHTHMGYGWYVIMTTVVWYDKSDEYRMFASIIHVISDNNTIQVNIHERDPYTEY
jgi:hypothetical protein